MKHFKSTLVFVLMSSIWLSSCKKGDTGPAGAVGPAGSANVQYSTWSSLNMAFSSQDSLYEQTITADSLKQAILDSGVVLTYIKFTDPNTHQISVANAASYMEVILSVGKISLFSTFDFSGFSFRYVIIPGGVRTGRVAPGSLGSYSKAELQKMSYDEVMKMLQKQ